MPGGGTDNVKYAATDPQTKQPVQNGARNVWVTETALTTALNTAFMADRLALFGIVVGIALLLSGIGFAVLSLAGALRTASSASASATPRRRRRPAPPSRSEPAPHPSLPPGAAARRPRRSPGRGRTRLWLNCPDPERCPSGLRSATGNRVRAERCVEGSNPSLSAKISTLRTLRPLARGFVSMGLCDLKPSSVAPAGGSRHLSSPQDLRVVAARHRHARGRGRCCGRSARRTAARSSRTIPSVPNTERRRLD